MKKQLLFLLVSIVFFVSCRTNSDENSTMTDVTDAVSVDYTSSETLVTLYRQNDSLINSGKMDTALLRLFIEKAVNYALHAPEDTLAPHFMFYAAIFEMDIALSTSIESKRNRLFFSAINYFNQVIETYPSYRNLPYCFFYKGQIYENMKRISDAENEYRELVHRFPNSDLGKNIADYLKVRGFEKTSDELMMEIN